MRRAWIALALALTVAACTDDAAPEAAASAPVEMIEVIGATLTYPALVDSGVAMSTTAIDMEGYEAAYLDPVERPVPLAFALRDCVVRADGRVVYDVQWRPPEDVEIPVDVVLSVTPGGRLFPYYLAAGLGLYEVELARPGTFRITADLGDGVFGGDDERQISVSDADPGSCELDVVSERYIDDQTAAPVQVRWDDTLLANTAPMGSFQSLAGSAHPTAAFVERLLLDGIDDEDLWPDRIWFDPNGDPDFLAITDRLGCRQVRSEWDDGAVTLLQQRGCEDGLFSSDDRVVSVVDSAWTVTVNGASEAVDALVVGLRALPVAGVEALADGPVEFDPLARFELESAEEGRIEYGRVPWRDGVVVAWGYDDDLGGEIATFAVDGGEWFNAGGGGTPIQPGICVAQLRSANDLKGFAIAVFDDPGITRLERQLADGQWEEVDVIANGPYRIAMLDPDLRTVAGVGPDRTVIRGFDAAGDEIDCVRSN
ncbi:MAG: hypothetical protein R2707_15440 [Acidimicrobiales bacterium]